MKTITREALLALGGAPDAKYVVFYPSGGLYMCTTAKWVVMDEAYWAERGYTMKEVVDGDAA